VGPTAPSSDSTHAPGTPAPATPTAPPPTLTGPLPTSATAGAARQQQGAGGSKPAAGARLGAVGGVTKASGSGGLGAGAAAALLTVAPAGTTRALLEARSRAAHARGGVSPLASPMDEDPPTPGPAPALVPAPAVAPAQPSTGPEPMEQGGDEELEATLLPLPPLHLPGPGLRAPGLLDFVNPAVAAKYGGLVANIRARWMEESGGEEMPWAGIATLSDLAAAIDNAVVNSSSAWSHHRHVTDDGKTVPPSIIKSLTRGGHAGKGPNDMVGPSRERACGGAGRPGARRSGQRGRGPKGRGTPSSPAASAHSRSRSRSPVQAPGRVGGRAGAGAGAGGASEARPRGHGPGGRGAPSSANANPGRADAPGRWKPPSAEPPTPPAAARAQPGRAGGAACS